MAGNAECIQTRAASPRSLCGVGLAGWDGYAVSNADLLWSDMTDVEKIPAPWRA